MISDCEVLIVEMLTYSEAVRGVVEEGNLLNDALCKVAVELSSVRNIWHEVEKRNEEVSDKYEEELKCVKESKEVVEKKLQDALQVKEEVVFWKQKFNEAEDKNDAEKAKLQEELKDNYEQIEMLCEENEELRAEAKKKGKKEELKVWQEKFDSLENDYKDFSVKFVDKVKMVKFLYDRVSKMEKIADSYQKSYRGKSEENEVLMRKLAQLEQNLFAKQEKENGLEEGITALENLTQHADENAEKPKHGNEISLEKHMEVHQNAVKNEELIGEIKMFEEANSMLQNENGKLNEEIKIFENKMKDIKRGNDSYQIGELNNKIKVLEEENERVKKSLIKEEAKYENILLLPGKQDLERENKDLKQQLDNVLEATEAVQAIIRVELDAYEKKLKDVQQMLNEERAKKQNYEQKVEFLIDRR